MAERLGNLRKVTQMTLPGQAGSRASLSATTLPDFHFLCNSDRSGPPGPVSTGVVTGHWSTCSPFCPHLVRVPVAITSPRL